MPRSFRGKQLSQAQPPLRICLPWLLLIWLGGTAQVWAEGGPPAPPPPAAEPGAEGSFVFILDDAAASTLVAPTLRITPSGGVATDIALTDDGALSVDTPSDHVWIGVGRFATGAKVSIQVWDTSRSGTVTQTQQLDLSLPGTDGAQVRIEAAPPAAPPGSTEAPRAEEVPRPAPPQAEISSTTDRGWLLGVGAGVVAVVLWLLWPMAPSRSRKGRLIPAQKFSAAQISAWRRGVDTPHLNLVLPWPDIPSTLNHLLSYLGPQREGEVWVVSDQDPKDILTRLTPELADPLAPRLRWLRASQTTAEDIYTHLSGSIDPRVVIIDGSSPLLPMGVATAAGWVSARMDDVCTDLGAHLAVEVWVVWMEMGQQDLALGNSRPERFLRWNGLWTPAQTPHLLVGFQGETKTRLGGGKGA